MRNHLLEREVRNVSYACRTYEMYNKAMVKIHGRIEELLEVHEGVMKDTHTPYFKRLKQAEFVVKRVVRLEEVSKRVTKRYYGK